MMIHPESGVPVALVEVVVGMAGGRPGDKPEGPPARVWPRPPPQAHLKK